MFAPARRRVNEVAGRVDVIAIVARVGFGPSSLGLSARIGSANARTTLMRFPQDAAEFFNRVGAGDGSGAATSIRPSGRSRQRRNHRNIVAPFPSRPASPRTRPAMCNLTTSPKTPGDPGLHAGDARRHRQYAPLPGIFLDYSAPFRDGPEGRELRRWRARAVLALSAIFALKGRNSDQGVTNIRNVSSPHWRRWLGVDSRCVVPFSSFSENEVFPDGSRPPGRPERRAATLDRAATVQARPKSPDRRSMGAQDQIRRLTKWRRASRRAMGRNQP